MREEIRPCPFCGGRAVDVVVGTAESFVECDDCEATGPIRKGPEDAIESWNGCGRGSRESSDAISDEEVYLRAITTSPDEDGLSATIEFIDGCTAIELTVDAESAAKIVMAKGLRLRLVEDGDDR